MHGISYQATTPLRPPRNPPPVLAGAIRKSRRVDPLPTHLSVVPFGDSASGDQVAIRFLLLPPLLPPRVCPIRTFYNVTSPQSKEILASLNFMTITSIPMGRQPLQYLVPLIVLLLGHVPMQTPILHQCAQAHEAHRPVIMPPAPSGEAAP